MINALQYLNFGERYVSWVKLLYSNISSTVMNNGWASGYFPLYRGVRQGCPASPYLFLICAEILAHAVRADKDIKGILIQDTLFKLTQYADDTTMFLDGTLSSLNATLSLLLKFQKISGLKVNFEKSSAAKLASLQLENTQFRTIRRITWITDSIFILGIHIPLRTNIAKLLESNFSPTIDKITDLLTSWKKRSLTLLGKICVIKMLAIPKLVYLFTVLPNPPESFISTIEKLFKDFIWDGKRNKIKLHQLYQDYRKGGLKLTSVRNFCESLKISWVKRLAPCENRVSKSCILNNYFLQPYNSSLIWKGNLNHSDVKFLKIKSVFLNHVMVAWCRVHFIPLSDLDSQEQKRSQMLWGNSHIRINNRPVFFRKWIDQNIIYVDDLLEPTGQFHSFDYLKNQLHIQSHFLEYCGLRTAIPWRFSENLSEVENIQDMAITHLQQTMFCPSRVHYTRLLTTVQFHSRWLDAFNEAEESRPFEILHQCTIDRKLRNFQFKLIYKILPTNTLLEKMHVKSNNICNFCKIESDSLLHIYCTCKCLEFFWADVQSLIETVLKDQSIDFALDNKAIILGYLGNEKWGNVINFLILFAKYHIHCCYWTCKMPVFDVFFLKLKYHHHVELDIAISHNKIEQYIQKYKALNAIFAD